MGDPLFVDRTAIIGWVFMSIFTAFLVLISYVFQRDGGFHQFNPLAETGVMLMFWLGGLAGLGYFLGMPIVRIWVVGDEMVIRERWLVRGRTSRYALGMLDRPVIETIRDSDGDTYNCVLITPEKHRVIFSHHTEQKDAEASLQRFNAAAGLEIPLAQTE